MDLSKLLRKNKRLSQFLIYLIISNINRYVALEDWSNSNIQMLLLKGKKEVNY